MMPFMVQVVAMRWAIAVLFLFSQIVYAAENALPFEKLAQKAADARQTNHLPEAVQYYRRAVQIRPSWAEGWWSLGSIYYDEDLYAEARDAFERSLVNSKTPTPAYAFLGLCEYEMRDYASARAHLKEWLAAGAPGNAQVSDVAHFHWAELLTQDGRFFEALLQLHREVTAHGPTPSLVEAMGLAWMQMKSVPEDYSPEKREMVWLAGSGATWFSAGRQDRALEYLDRLDKRYGDQPNVHFLRGFVFESNKDVDGAIREYSQEASITPGAVAPMIQLALLYSEAGDQEKALEAARKAVALGPDNARTHFALGRVLAAGQNWSESAAELEKAKGLSPNTAKIHFQLANVYRKLGRQQEAEHEETVFETLDKSERGQSMAEDLSNMRDGLARNRQ